MKYKLLRFPGGKSKAVTLSYDDGSRHDIDLLNIINRYNLKCTFNICSGFISDREGEYFLTENEIREHMIEAGHEIAVHGEQHKPLGKQSPIDGIRDILNCREALERKYNRIIRGSAYADSGILSFVNGVTYDTVRKYLSDLGIAYARSVGGDNNNFMLPDDWYNWIPTAHHGNPHIFEYIEKFNRGYDDGTSFDSRTPMLFYLWGHSFEFEKNNNREHLVKICEMLGNRDDVWYATNIEIYNYVNAFKSLVFSADSRIVFNPTSYDIWFDADREINCIKSGETAYVKVRKKSH